MLGVGRKEMVMVAVMLAGTLLAVLNQTLLSPALPTIMNSLDVDATTVQWLTSGYSLVEAVIIPLSAFLIGRFTTRQLFNTGFVIFMLGSLAAAIAPNFWVLLLGRVLQASCTGMVMPMVFTVILLVFPREKRGTAMGTIGLIIGFAPAIGPSVAGLLVDTVGWRWLFGIVTILSVIVLVFAFASLKNYGDFKRTTFDPLSVALSTVGLVCLLYGLSTFSSSDNLLVTGALILVGVILVAVYTRRQFKLPVPMLNISILKTRNYAVSVIIIVIVQAALMGTAVITPLYIQGVCGYSATMSGVAMLPGAVIGAFMGLVSGRLFDRFGVRKIVVPGSLVALGGSFCLTLLGMDTAFILITLAYTVLTIGLQFTMTPLNTWGVNALSNDVLQHAQGLSNTLNQVAASLGTAVLVSISALSPLFAPDASPLEQMFLGDHMAFCTTAALLAVAVLVVIFFVSDKRKAAVPAGEDVDFSAGFDGVTVDASQSEDLAAAVPASDSDYEQMRVVDAMNREPVVVTTQAQMSDVITLMADNDTSGVPVVDEQRKLVGFVTDGDVASYLGRNDIAVVDSTLNLYRFVDDSELKQRLFDLLDLNVMSIATKHVISVEQSMPLDEAVHVLSEKRIKKVPVVDASGKLVGALSRRNVVKSIAAAIKELEANKE